MSRRSSRNNNYSGLGINPRGIYRATVASINGSLINVKIPRLGLDNIYENVPVVGPTPSVSDDVFVGFIEGNTGNPVAFTSDDTNTGDIESVIAGTALSGGGTSGDVTVNFAPSELSSVTVATDDKVVIADTSDSDNPKHVTAQSIANLASASPGGSTSQIQYNNSGSFAGSANFTFDGTSTVTLTDTDAGSAAAPILELYRNSASAADADYIGQIKFQGENDNDQKVMYAKITGKIDDASDGSEDGIIEIAHQKAGSNNISARFTSDALKLINGTGLEVDGTIQIDGALTVGVDDTGLDVKFFGATSGKYMLWDESADALIVKDTVDAVNYKINGGQGSDGQVLTSTGSGVAWEDQSPPTGAVVMWSGSSAPTGWLECDGSAVSRTTYSALFAIIGTRYGTGDGSSTFNLPNPVDRLAMGIALSTTPSATTLAGSSALDALGLGNQSADHSHTGNTNEYGNHSHNANTGNAGSHAHNMNSANIAHTHTYSKSNSGSQTTSTSGNMSTNANHGHNLGNAGSHSHNFATGNTGAHTHNVTVGDNSADHNHSLSSSTISTTVNVEPFGFIIKT